MNKVEKLILRFVNGWKDNREFGFTIAISSFIWPFLGYFPKDISRWLMQRKHAKVLRYLTSNYREMIYNFHFEQESPSDFNGAIWFCWLQGEDNMPLTVRTCLKALKCHANGHPVIIISLNNYQEYITLPDYVIDKYHKGEIGNAHFADILRTCLLYEHGGVWMDSTLLAISNLPEELFKSSFYSCRFEADTLFITQCRWSNFFLGSQKGGIVFAFTRTLLFEYIKNENRFIDYFLMDYIIYLGYITYSEVRNRIDQLCINNINIHGLAPIINDSFNHLIWNELIQNTYLFKLSWKGKYNDTNSTTLSYWGYIKQELERV